MSKQQHRATELWVITAKVLPSSVTGWAFVSKYPGMHFTHGEKNARIYKTYKGAVRAMEKLRANSPEWKFVGNNCEVYNLNYKEERKNETV